MTTKNENYHHEDKGRGDRQTGEITLIENGIRASIIDYAFNPEQRKVSFCFFVNPKSGGKKGQLLLNNLKNQGEKFGNFWSSIPGLENIAHVYISIVSMFDIQNRSQIFQGFSDQSKKKKNSEVVNCFAIACGGDGTIIWIIEELIKHQADFTNIALTMLPLGTGNDFSSATGFGCDPPKDLFKSTIKRIKKLIIHYLLSQIKQLDIWDMEITTQEGGGIQKVTNNNGKAKLTFFGSHDDEQDKFVRDTVFKRKMSNYFSVGLDAKVGFCFEKKRKNSRFKNKMVYFFEGLKRFFIPQKRIKNMIEKLEILRPDVATSTQYSEQNRGLDTIESESTKEEQHPLSTPLISLTSSSNYDEDGDYLTASSDKPLTVDTTPSSRKLMRIQVFLTDKRAKKNVLTINPLTLNCFNIPSYMGGVKNSWNKSKKKSPILLDTIYSKKIYKQFRKKQKINDGYLEFLSFNSKTSLALERFCTGLGRRVGQGKGPFLITFRDHFLGTKKKVYSYVQVDGEFMKIYQPKTVKISLCKDLPNGQINIIINKKQNSQ